MLKDKVKNKIKCKNDRSNNNFQLDGFEPGTISSCSACYDARPFNCLVFCQIFGIYCLLSNRSVHLIFVM